MEAFAEFSDCTPAFWSLVKFVSETLGYTQRGRTRADSRVKTYCHTELYSLFNSHGLNIDDDTVSCIISYSQKRAAILNDVVQHNLMTAEQAEVEFYRLYEIAVRNHFQCKLPMNKQSGAMKKVNYFSAIINILTEMTIRESNLCPGQLGFNDDPRGLIYLMDDAHQLAGASSRRFDGALPGIINPVMVWEIKEYYYATTFGSRVADGVYETQLDGFELNEIYNRTGHKIKHVFMVDAYKTWWVDGKSYLCRIIDALNAGLVDEAIFGREVLTRWPIVINSVLFHNC